MGADFVELVEAFVDERVASTVAAPTTPDGPKWLTYEQAAQVEGCSVDAVRMRAARGRYQTRHVGRRVYVARESVDPIVGRS